MKKRTRLDPVDRKQEILNAAMRLSSKIGYSSITRSAVAKEAGIADRLVSYYFNTVFQLKKSVIKSAILRAESYSLIAEKDLQDASIQIKDELSIIAQALAIKDPLAIKISETLKEKIIAHTTSK